MQELQTTIRNQVGLHARPAALFVKAAKGFRCKITVSKGDRVADAKSILTILALGAEQGSTITVRTDGDDEVQALEALKGLLDDNFGETE